MSNGKFRFKEKYSDKFGKMLVYPFPFLYNGIIKLQIKIFSRGKKYG